MEGTLKVTIMYEGTVEAAESNKSIFPAGGSNLKGTQSPSEDCICPCQARRCVCWAPSCALSHPASTHTHQFWYNCTGKHFSLSAHSVLPPFCCRCQARGQADLPKVPSPPYAQHGPLLYLCIHRTADQTSVLISGRNLLFHWDHTDPRNPTTKTRNRVPPNDCLNHRRNGIMGREEARGGHRLFGNGVDSMRLKQTRADWKSIKLH